MVDFTQFIDEKETIISPSSDTVDFTQFVNKKEEVSKPDEGVGTIDFTKFIDTQQPQSMEFPEQSMDDLDIDQRWINNAAIIYQSEEGEKWKGSQKALAEWLKDRHSKLNYNITNMGLTAYDTKDMSDETKRAWVESITQYDNTDADLYSFGRALKHATLTDPVFWASLVGGIGIGGIAKAMGGRAATQAGKMIFKDQLIKSLMKTGVTEAAAKEAVKKGVTKEVSKELLEETAKSVAKTKGNRVGIQTAAAEGAYMGLENLADQAVEIGLDYDLDLYKDAIEEGKDPDQAREEARKENLDFGELGLNALAGAGLGYGLGRLGSKFMDKRATRKLLLQSERMAAREEVPKVGKTVSNISPTTSERDLINEANRVQRELELNGTVDINTQSSRVALNNQVRQAKKEAQELRKTDEWKKKSAGEKKKYNKDHRQKLKDILESGKKQEEDLEKTFNAANIRVTKVGKDKFVGEKIAETSETIISDVIGQRTLSKKIIAKIKKYTYDDSGMGDAAKRAQIRRKSAIQAIKRNVLTRHKQLEKAIKKNYKSKLNVIPKSKYVLMNAALQGSKEAIDQLSKEAPDVLESLKGMRDNIFDLQKELKDSGAIVKDSDLETKIINSMDGKDGTELYITRQFEVYDNPDFGKVLNETPEGQEVIRRAKEHLAIQNAVTNKKFSEVKGLKDSGVTLTDEQTKIYNDYMGEDGIIDNTIKEMLVVNDEEDLFRVFKDRNLFQKDRAGKILTKRGDIPEDIRALMGEYTDPFTNYANTATKLFQTAETFKYEKAIADLIEAGDIKDAQKGINIEGEVTRELKSTLPSGRGVERPLEGGQGIVKPLEGFFGTNEVADYIANGNEIAINYFKPLQAYSMLQGHTRAAKTVYSPTAVARNFLGAAWMAFGAGYINPKHIGQVYRVFKSLGKRSDTALNADMEKGIALGYLQSGTELGALRGALRDAGEKEFWDLTSPLYKGGRTLTEKAKRANTTATKLYQSMDDMWKQYAFMNERASLRQVLKDKGLEPDEVASYINSNGDKVYRRFMSADGVEISITNLDEAAAEAVNNHMQNYANVPKFIKGLRLAPAADFLAFKSEIIRTQKNILKSAITDIRDGRALMASSDNLKGKAQRNLGYKRLGSMIAAQAAGPAVAVGSANYVGLNETEPGQTNTIKEGIEAFDAPYNKGANFFYYGDYKNGKGKRVNISYINPWATTQAPIMAAIAGLTRTGDYVEDAVDNAFQTSVIDPVADAFSPSMLAEAIISFGRNRDEHGRPIFGKDRYTTGQNIANSMAAIFSPFEPGVIKSARDLITAYNLEGKEFGVKEKGRELVPSDQWIGLTGIKPEQYDIALGLNFKMYDLKNRMGDTTKIFQETYRRSDPITVDELTDSYSQSLERQFALATEMFDYISKAKSAGLNNTDIYEAITHKGLFKNRMDKNILYNMINKGVFVPPPPLNKDVYKWGLDIKRRTAQQPPVKEAQRELMNIYRSYVGSTTGLR